MSEDPQTDPTPQAPAREEPRHEGASRPRHLSRRAVTMIIANQLQEQDEQVQTRIQHIVWDLGRTQALALAREAMLIQDHDDQPSQKNRSHLFFSLVETKGKKKERPWLNEEQRAQRGPKPQRKDDPLQAVATTIADQLGETETGPRTQVSRVVRTLGEETARTYLQRTLDIQASGGMLLPDQSRKRTPGGVFFFLIRQEVSPEQRQHIFFFSSNKPPTTASTPNATQPKPQPQELTALTWQTRQQVMEEANQQRGEAKTVKVTLIGRPGKIVAQGQCIVTSMQQGTTIPALPKGLPLPTAEQVEPTHYTVYIATKQWNKVAQVIKADSDDVLIIEGWQMLDKAHATIAVFASNVTTKKLMIAQKQSKVTPA
jgi:hypothetical protein